MRKYKFNTIQKYALWVAFGKKCFYCGEPLAFSDVTIDHIIPEKLLGKPSLLKQLLEDYEILASVPDFEINSYHNWVPSHGTKCNTRKGAHPFPKPTTLFYLNLVQRTLPKVYAGVDKAKQNISLKHGKTLAVLESALERGAITAEEINSVLEKYQYSSIQDSPLVVCFGLTMEDAESCYEDEYISHFSYPQFCDWLEQELERVIENRTDYDFHFSEPSLRDGEQLSIRLVFPYLTVNDISQLHLESILSSLFCWNLLEVDSFDSIYGESYTRHVFKEVSKYD